MTINLKLTENNGTITIRDARNNKVAGCNWSGNMGYGAAMATIRTQLKNRYDAYILYGRDQFGEMVVLEQWSEAEEEAERAAAEQELIEHDQQMEAEWAATHS